MRAQEVVRLIAAADENGISDLEERFGDDSRRQVQDALARARRRLAREKAERDRIDALYDEMGRLSAGGLALGVDEVGRGAVAGPLTVCAVALPMEPKIQGLNDSKKLSPQRREVLAAEIARFALAIGICHIGPADIDRDGMAASLRRAMKGAIEDAGVDPSAVLIDGNPVHVHEREVCVVKGDARIACISAASIVAKVTRDALMVELDKVYPGYHFAHSKGYASAEHIEAIRKLGTSEVHRKTFCEGFVEPPTLF